MIVTIVGAGRLAEGLAVRALAGLGQRGQAAALTTRGTGELQAAWGILRVGTGEVPDVGAPAARLA